MSLSRLSQKCRKRPFVEECDRKQMDEKPITVYKDEIEKQLYGHLYSQLGLQYGG